MIPQNDDLASVIKNQILKKWWWFSLPPGFWDNLKKYLGVSWGTQQIVEMAIFGVFLWWFSAETRKIMVLYFTFEGIIRSFRPR